MLEYLKGKVVSRMPTQAVIDVNGIGYALNISLNTFEQLPADGEEVLIRTYLHVREDGMQLFGFANAQERSVFLGLISVSGVGPKLAQTVLSGISVADLVQAISGEDTGRLTSISGIGKKTAQRLVVELKEKFANLGLIETKGAAQQSEEPLGTMEEEALMALLALGYKKPGAERAIQKTRKNGKVTTIEELVKQALQVI